MKKIITLIKSYPFVAVIFQILWVKANASFPAEHIAGMIVRILLQRIDQLVRPVPPEFVSFFLPEILS